MIQIQCAIQEGDWSDDNECEAISKRAIGAAVQIVSDNVPNGAEVSLLFTNDKKMQSLNAQWRDQDKPTNVLSFAVMEGNGPSTPILGDIILAHETIAREADEQGKSFNDHLNHLIVHGFLHLLGYDHVEDGEAEKMEQLEREICASLGIADPYDEH